ncbi:hypothetical protein BSKO_09607 [Bryopsis sp. KO-2023]|nr:hypothetical protein BSKO_09607 [Bryopsis sp. KO-2023]
MGKTQEIASLRQELAEARNREYWAVYRVEQLARRAPVRRQPRHGPFVRFIRRWLLCCLPHEPDEEEWIFSPTSGRPNVRKGKKVELVRARLTASAPANAQGDLIPARHVTFAGTDGSPKSTSSTSTGSLTSGPSSIGAEDTMPSGSPPDSPSSESSGGASEASTSQGTELAREDSQSAKLANVVDVNLLIGKLSLEGTWSPDAIHHSPETALTLLEGCCRASIPQPADSTYSRDLSHSFHPMSPHIPASYPTTPLPQLADPHFFRHLDPACFQDGSWGHGREDDSAFHCYDHSQDELQ